MKKLLIPIILLLLVTPALAFEYKTNGEYSLEELKTTYNQNPEKIPWIVKQIIGDERINLYLTTNTGDIVIGGVTENAKIMQVQEGEIENPTLNIYVTETTINKLKNQEITIQQALDAELIKYESVSVITSVKLWFADKIMTIVSWFT